MARTTEKTTQVVKLITKGQKYTTLYTLTQKGNSLVVERQENIYTTKISTIPTWWDTEEENMSAIHVSPLITLAEILNCATIAEDGENWTDQEFNEEYGDEGHTEEEMKKIHDDYNEILRATRATFPNTDLNALLSQVEMIVANIEFANEYQSNK